MKPESIKDDQIIKALKDLMDAPKPILVHCARGSDRTGVVIAMYRIIFQNWTKEEAIKEMRDGGYGFHTGYTNIVSYIEKVDIEKMKKKLNE
jgi:tyrosine-protein phosphatase SIW14